MNTQEKLDEIFAIYSKVALLSDKNDCLVMRLRHRELGRDIVLRRVPKPNKVFQILTCFRHPNIAETYDVFDLEDGTVILEEYVSGMNLFQLSKVEKTEKKRAVKIARDVCSALDALHGRNIVHRDIKPENIVISDKNEVKLIDFGAARTVSNASADTVIMGTVGYAAPEQLGIVQSDSRVDIFALGVLINVMMTGAHPSIQLAEGKLGKIVRKCTDIIPLRRYQSAKELHSALMWV